MKTISQVAVCAALVQGLIAVGCTNPPAREPALDAGYTATQSTVTHDPCVGEGWRQPTVNGVVCPGASQCECTGTDVCCLQAVDSSKGTCESAGSCRYLELTCDGPEDCAPTASSTDGGAPVDRVCCMDEAVGTGGGGSSCRAASACNGKVLCRSDDDCKVTQGLVHCRPADYGTPGVEDRGLDGLVGECAR